MSEGIPLLLLLLLLLIFEADSVLVMGEEMTKSLFPIWGEEELCGGVFLINDDAKEVEGS